MSLWQHASLSIGILVVFTLVLAICARWVLALLKIIVTGMDRRARPQCPARLETKCALIHWQLFHEPLESFRSKYRLQCSYLKLLAKTHAHAYIVAWKQFFFLNSDTIVSWTSWKFSLHICRPHCSCLKLPAKTRLGSTCIFYENETFRASTSHRRNSIVAQAKTASHKYARCWIAVIATKFGFMWCRIRIQQWSQ